MVKLAQHIEWPSQLPLRAGEGASASSGTPNVKKVDRLLSNGKPRKTLAELFETRATSSPSSSSSTMATTLPSSATAILPPSASSTLLPAPARASSSSSFCSSSVCTSSLSTSVSSTTSSISTISSLSLAAANAHVTFDDKLSAIQHKPSAYRGAELAASIKRSSSARKIADSSAHEGFHTHPSPKKTSKSGPLLLSEPLARNPLTKTGNSEPSRWISPTKPSKGHSNENSNGRSSSALKQEQRTQSTYSSHSEQRYKSPYRTHEHNQKDFLVKGLQNQSRFREDDSDLFGNKKDAGNDDTVQTVQSTPTKVKKFKKGLFSLLTDGVGMKHSGSEARESEIPGVRASTNLGKVTNANLSGGETGAFVTLPKKVTENVGLVNQPVDTEIEHVGSWISGNVGKHEGGREANSFTVEIPEKMVGLAWLGAMPRLLSSGTYSVPSEGFMLEQVVSERSSYVKHGMLHRVRIREGHLGVAWVDGKAVLLEAGVSVHMCPSNKFSYITTDNKMIAEKEFVLGPFRVVTVNDSEVGIKFCNRQPQILYSGRHCLSISKVEVFAGFESLLRRQSNVREASALSSDNMKVCADVWLEWQIKAEDAAAARLANITDVEGAVCSQVRRAFNLVIWEVNAHDLNQQLTGSMENSNKDSHPLLKNVSFNIHRECQDLFEEGWTVTIWDLKVRQLVIFSEVKDT